MPVVRTKRLPPLETVDHADRATFGARYEAMPSDTRAQLTGARQALATAECKGFAASIKPKPAAGTRASPRSGRRSKR